MAANESFNGTIGRSTPEPVYVQVIKIIACVIVLVIALVGNILIIVVIQKNTSMRKTINYFIVNMAVSDLIVPLVILPRLIIETATQSQEWRGGDGLFGGLLCKFVYFISDITMVVSILSLICIAIDRFCAVVFPLKLSLITSRVRVGLLIFIWLFSIFYYSGFFYAMRLHKVEGQTQCILIWSEDEKRHRTFHSAFSIASTILLIIVPAILLTLIYSTILVIVRIKIVSNQEQQGNKDRRAANNSKLLKLALLTVGAFAVCYGPFNIYIFYATFVHNWTFSSYESYHKFAFAVEFLSYTNSALNPCLYFVFIENFRRGLFKLFNCRAKKTRDTLYSTETTKATRMVRIDYPRSSNRTSEERDTRLEKETLIEKS